MKLAIFDFNGTIFPRETMPFLLHCWYRNKLPRTRLITVFSSLLPLFVKYKANISSSMTKEEMEAEAMHRFCRLFYGMSREEVARFFSRAADTASELFNREIISEITRARRDGYHLVLLSGAFYLFLLQVGEKLKMDAVIGSELPFVDGYFDSGRGLKLIRGSEKLESLREAYGDEVDWDNSRAYADSYWDLPLLEAVGCPVPVDPDERLGEIARQRGWQIIYGGRRKKSYVPSEGDDAY